MLAPGGKAHRGARLVISLAAVAAAAVAGTATSVAPAAAAPAAGQSVLPGPPAAFSWGWNEVGENGDGTTTPRDTPGPVLGLPSVNGAQVTVKQFAGDGGGVWSFSRAALLADGTVYTWGGNYYGELGDGTTTQRLTPGLVPGLSGITQIAQGLQYMLATGADGVWAWGHNGNGQLGDGTATDRTSPVRVAGLTGITQVAAGDSHSLALRSDGTVLSWGNNDYGQLGTGTTVSRPAPGPVPGLTGIIQVAAGGELSYALRSDGTLFAWGAPYLGNGFYERVTEPIAVPLAGVTQVATSGADTLAIAGPGHTVYAWGANADGEIGNGTSSDPVTNASVLSPVQLGLSGVTQVSEGAYASAAIRSDGSLFTWGDNHDFNLGIGANPRYQLVPARVIYLSNVSQVSLVEEGGLAAGQYDAARIPSVVDYTQSEASEALSAAGFTLGRVAVVVDLTCQFIGVVKTQTPPAGTLAVLGTAVNVTIGKPGGKCL
jgi:alpha-tubulin suppressor-like RCC1 family protein